MHLWVFTEDNVLTFLGQNCPIVASALRSTRFHASAQQFWGIPPDFFVQLSTAACAAFSRQPSGNWLALSMLNGGAKRMSRHQTRTYITCARNPSIPARTLSCAGFAGRHSTVVGARARAQSLAAEDRTSRGAIDRSRLPGSAHRGGRDSALSGESFASIRISAPAEAAPNDRRKRAR